MIAKVVPALRTPRSVDEFDYSIPNGMDLEVGSIVRIPFRNREIIGVVRATHETSSTEKPLKDILDGYAELRFRNETLELLSRLSKRSFTSAPSVLHAWLGTMPKRVPKIPFNVRRKIPELIPQKNFRHVHNHLLNPNGIIATARRESKTKSVLILTPWATRARWIADQINVPALTHRMPSGARFKAWSGFLTCEHSILVTTRVGAWLACEADLVILDEPENDDHKQDDLAPRFDPRWIVDQAADLGTSVVSIGLTPRLNQLKDAKAPEIQPDLLTVDIHRSDWSNVSGLQNRTLLAIEHHTGPTLIIHPIHGERARLRCAECSWHAHCANCGAGLSVEHGELMCRRCKKHTAMNMACPNCGSHDLSESRPGRESLIRDLETAKIHTEVFSLGDWNTRVELAPQSLVVLTDLTLFPGAFEDVRRRERCIVSFRRLADFCASHNARLVVQGDAKLLTDAKQWLTQDGCITALRQELEERNTFKYPPAILMLKILFRNSESDAKAALAKIRARCRDACEITGPFPVLLRSQSREKRSVAHVRFLPNTSEDEIRQIIQPILETNALLDLDPIAFFE